jgi:hypothetical protein
MVDFNFVSEFIAIEKPVSSALIVVLKDGAKSTPRTSSTCCTALISEGSKAAA